MSHLLFTCCMFATIFTSTLKAIYIIVAFSGVSWAVAVWAPFALIGTHICDSPEHDIETFPSESADVEKRPGIVLGLHNVAIAAPQVFAAAASSIIFWLLEGMETQSCGNNTSWVLCAAGLCAFAAAFLARACDGR